MAQLEIGIVGLPNVGKSTLFKLLTNHDITIANYPFATIDPNVGIVPVPDPRVDRLAALSSSKKKIPAVVEFYDIAGLVKGANKGEGLGNQFLSHIRETQAIVIVLRVFKNDDIIHVENSVDPVRDLDIVLTELVLKDLEGVEKRLAKADTEARTGKKEATQDRALLVRLKECLEKGNLPVADAALAKDLGENLRLADLNLLTAKRQIYLLNGSASEVSAELRARIAALGGEVLVANLGDAMEAETAGDGTGTSGGSMGRAIAELTKKAYATLGLISFFTTGEDETRAWTITRGMKAPQAAGVIHTDFETKFIRLEAVGYDKLIEAGSWAVAKQKGWVRVEGKDYVVQDGDVVVVRHG